MPISAPLMLNPLLAESLTVEGTRRSRTGSAEDFAGRDARLQSLEEVK